MTNFLYMIHNCINLEFNFRSLNTIQSSPRFTCSKCGDNRHTNVSHKLLSATSLFHCKSCGFYEKVTKKILLKNKVPFIKLNGNITNINLKEVSTYKGIKKKTVHNKDVFVSLRKGRCIYCGGKHVHGVPYVYREKINKNSFKIHTIAEYMCDSKIWNGHKYFIEFILDSSKLDICPICHSGAETNYKKMDGTSDYGWIKCKNCSYSANAEIKK